MTRPKFSTDEVVAEVDPDAAWKAALEPFGYRWMIFTNQLEADLNELDNDALAVLLGATYKPTSTNCWFASFHAAPLVQDAIHRIRSNRRALGLEETTSK